MRTLKDLVDRLNRGDQLNDNFRTSGNRESDYSIDLNRNEIILFSLKDRTYSFTSYISWVNDKDQDLIVKYLANHTPDDWFAEKKYYIAVGMYDSTSKLIYYKKDNTLDFTLRTMIDFDEKYLEDEDIFTENEIEELKSTLPENMQKIVDIGKVEVKDD